MTPHGRHDGIGRTNVPRNWESITGLALRLELVSSVAHVACLWIYQLVLAVPAPLTDVDYIYG